MVAPNLNLKHECPTELKEFFGKLAQIGAEQASACASAAPALQRLCQVMSARTGQSYKVRAFLFSMWNGQPASMLEIVGLDWDVRKDVAKVWLAWGAQGFFYDQLKEAVCAAQQWAWFLEEGDVKP